ncbi:MAG: DUF4193 family protein [Actinomycetota bacterium]
MPPRTPPTDDFADEEPEEQTWLEAEEDPPAEQPDPAFEPEPEAEEEQGEDAVVAFAEAEVFEEEDLEEGEAEQAEEEGEAEEAEEAEEGEEEALDELEAEELDMLTDDEVAELLPVDEVEELRKLRREAIELEIEANAVAEDEFVCSNCFLVKRTTQLADKRKTLCRDCI